MPQVKQAHTMVAQHAAALAREALADAKQSGAFDTVASAMLIAIAGIVRQECGSEALADFLAIAARA